jgi:hypothetical protein
LWIVVHVHYHPSSGCLVKDDEVSCLPDKYKDERAIFMQNPHHATRAVLALKDWGKQKMGGSFTADDLEKFHKECPPEPTGNHQIDEENRNAQREIIRQLVGLGTGCVPPPTLLSPFSLFVFPFTHPPFVVTIFHPLQLVRVCCDHRSSAASIHRREMWTWISSSSDIGPTQFFDSHFRIESKTGEKIKIAVLPPFCLGVAMALKKFVMSCGGSCTIDQFCSAQQVDQKIRTFVRRVTPEKLCQQFPSQLRCRNRQITLVPSYVNHVNFRFMEQCGVDDDPRIFLPTLHGRHYTPQKGDYSYLACGWKKFELMFDIWAGNVPNKWRWPNGPMSPRQLTPLLRWLEQQRFSKNCSMINTSEREDMRRHAQKIIGHSNLYKLSKADKKKNQAKKNQADNAYRADSTGSSEDDDGWKFGHDDGCTVEKNDDESNFAEGDDGTDSW